MLIRIVSGSTLRALEIEDISSVVVLTKGGDPCVVARDLPDGTVLAAHAAERDFQKMLRQVGMQPNNPVTKV